MGLLLDTLDFGLRMRREFKFLWVPWNMRHNCTQYNVDIEHYNKVIEVGLVWFYSTLINKRSAEISSLLLERTKQGLGYIGFLCVFRVVSYGTKIHKNEIYRKLDAAVFLSTRVNSIFCSKASYISTIT